MTAGSKIIHAHIKGPGEVVGYFSEKRSVAVQIVMFDLTLR